MTYWNEGNDEFIFNHWPDAEKMDEVTLASIMSTANALCVAFAPALPEDAVISDQFKLAEIFMARDIRNQSTVGNHAEYDVNGMPVSITRMNYLARDLLRPKRPNISRLR